MRNMSETGSAPPPDADEAGADADLAPLRQAEASSSRNVRSPGFNVTRAVVDARAGGRLDVGRPALREVVGPSGRRLQLAGDPERRACAPALGDGVDAESRVGPDTAQPVDRRVDGARGLGHRRIGRAARRGDLRLGRGAIAPARANVDAGLLDLAPSARGSARRASGFVE